MDAFYNTLKKHDLENSDSLSRSELTTLQVNMGNLCNQACKHCHVEASPTGNNIMSKSVINDILSFLSRYKIRSLDITGGAPEMNPHFEYFVQKARSLVDELIVRTNLTILQEKKHLVEFFRDNQVHLVGSLPCYLEQNVDSQRGVKVFDNSIDALKTLNSMGYAKDPEMQLDLVYNPVGANLPPSQEALEKDYKRVLADQYGVDFNRLITITNVPIKRFRDYLEAKGEYKKYCDLLKDNFNPGVLENIMCRTFLSVAYDGKLYDCDFNQALGLVLKDLDDQPMTIDKLDANSLIGQDIILGEHCLSCTAGSGSSCQGALVQDDTKQIKEDVKEYYGKVLKTNSDLKTSACCVLDTMEPRHRAILKKIDPAILDKFYGCGSPIPPELDNGVVVDLGCGTGRDVYIASYLVGETGKVIGVDMTDEQLAIAKEYQDTQMKKFGFNKTNVEFHKGLIEDLKTIGIKNDSVDVVTSNCVINLSSDKRQVFSEVFRVLKEGGEFYFSDVFADRRIPEEITKDPVLYGECLGGAMYIEDFRRIMQSVGFLDCRIVSKRKIDLNNDEIKNKVGMIEFYSMTIRVFKLSTLEDICEDYGQVATYKGSIEDHPHSFILDDHHTFSTNKPMLVCGNTASMLAETRYAKHFNIMGDRSIHHGAFDCSSGDSKSKDGMGSPKSCC